MYNLIILREDNEYYFSVFDQKNNEIWNEKGDMFCLTDKLGELRFTFDNVVHNNLRDFVLIAHLKNCDIVPKNFASIFDGKEFVYDAPIANESRSGYGFNRYCHRNFLQSKYVKKELFFTGV
jgi:hypothetical protein